MFISDKLIYLQLQKTGSTHIARLLSETVGGKQAKKHQKLAHTNTPNQKYIIGSIRDPWDWYVSLWAYGCSCRGTVYKNLTQRRMLRYLLETPLIFASNLLNEINKPIDTFKEVYFDSSNPNLFRNWLGMILDNKNRKYLRERYGQLPINNNIGFLSYRYLSLYTKNSYQLYRDNNLTDVNRLREFDYNNNILNYVVRFENLEEDLINAINGCGIQLDRYQTEKIMMQTKTNKSKREHNVDYYYDELTIDLVAKKEKFIINKYNYKNPVI